MGKKRGGAKCVCELPRRLALLSSPHSLFPSSLIWLHHVTRKSGSSPFPLLTERKYCKRGGRRWAVLRRWLKITGIFKAAEETQGRQRLDSLPPGRSSLLPPAPLPPLNHFYFRHDHRPKAPPYAPRPAEAHQ